MSAKIGKYFFLIGIFLFWGDIKFDKSSEEISRNMTRVGMVDQIVKKIKSNKLAEVEENQLVYIF